MPHAVTRNPWMVKRKRRISALYPNMASAHTSSSCLYVPSHTRDPVFSSPPRLCAAPTLLSTDEPHAKLHTPLLTPLFSLPEYEPPATPPNSTASLITSRSRTHYPTTVSLPTSVFPSASDTKDSAFTFTTVHQTKDSWEKMIFEFHSLKLSSQDHQRKNTHFDFACYVSLTNHCVIPDPQARDLVLRLLVNEQPLAYASKTPQQESASPRRPLTFLDLPLEIRHQVYQQVLVSPAPIKPQVYSVAISSLSEAHRLTMALTRVNREVRRETLAFLYARNYFRFSWGKVSHQQAPWQYARHIFVQGMRPAEPHMPHNTESWSRVFDKALPWNKLRQNLHTLVLEVKLSATWASSPVDVVAPLVQALSEILRAMGEDNDDAVQSATNRPLTVQGVTFVSGFHGKVDWWPSKTLTEGTACIFIQRPGTLITNERFAWPERHFVTYRGMKWRIEKGPLALVNSGEMTWISKRDSAVEA